MKNKVIELFLYKDKLKFSEIEDLTNLRSNKLAYYLKGFEEEKKLLKQEGSYSLSSDFEHVIPYISQNQAILPAVIIAIGKEENFFLHFREKKPYKGFLSLPAGRIRVGENINDAAKRIMKEKHGIDIKKTETHSVTIEHIKKNGKVIHSFLLILVSASTKDKLKYTDIELHRKKMIKSDYWLLKNNLKEKAKINVINSKISVSV